MPEIQFGFIQRALAADLVITIIVPLTGIFLVIRRYSLIVDSLPRSR